MGAGRKRNPKRSISYRLEAAWIISTAQQASPNVRGHTEPTLSQPTSVIRRSEAQSSPMSKQGGARRGGRAPPRPPRRPPRGGGTYGAQCGGSCSGSQSSHSASPPTTRRPTRVRPAMIPQARCRAARRRTVGANSANAASITRPLSSASSAAGRAWLGEGGGGRGHDEALRGQTVGMGPTRGGRSGTGR